MNERIESCQKARLSIFRERERERERERDTMRLYNVSF